MAYHKQFWEDAPDCNECRNMEREIGRLETQIDLLEQANKELRAELKHWEEPHVEQR